MRGIITIVLNSSEIGWIPWRLHQKYHAFSNTVLINAERIMHFKCKKKYSQIMRLVNVDVGIILNIKCFIFEIN